MKRALYFLFFLLAVSGSAGVWDETTPAGSAPISQGDDRIREMKEAIGDALEFSGVFPGTNPLTAPMYQWTENYGMAANRTSTLLQDGQVYISTDSGVREMYNGTTWVNVGIASTTTSALKISGNIISDGNITTSGDDVDVSTHMTVAGDLTVSGSLGMSGFTSIKASSASVQIVAETPTLLSYGTESGDTFNEFNGTTFTATNAGKYMACWTGGVRGASGLGDVLNNYAVYINYSGDSTFKTARREVISLSTSIGSDYFAICGQETMTAGQTLTTSAYANDVTGSDGGEVAVYKFTIMRVP